MCAHTPLHYIIQTTREGTTYFAHIILCTTTVPDSCTTEISLFTFVPTCDLEIKERMVYTSNHQIQAVYNFNELVEQNFTNNNTPFIDVFHEQHYDVNE